MRTIIKRARYARLKPKRTGVRIDTCTAIIMWSCTEHIFLRVLALRLIHDQREWTIPLLCVYLMQQLHVSRMCSKGRNVPERMGCGQAIRWVRKRLRDLPYSATCSVAPLNPYQARPRIFEFQITAHSSVNIPEGQVGQQRTWQTVTSRLLLIIAWQHTSESLVRDIDCVFVDIHRCCVPGPRRRNNRCARRRKVETSETA